MGVPCDVIDDVDPRAGVELDGVEYAWKTLLCPRARFVSGRRSPSLDRGWVMPHFCLRERHSSASTYASHRLHGGRRRRKWEMNEGKRMPKGHRKSIE
eukprot:gene1339-biopygen7056